MVGGTVVKTLEFVKAGWRIMITDLASMKSDVIEN